MTYLWVLFTVFASGGQVARNAMQRELTETVGTAGASFVRFLFGLPFGILFLAAVAAVTEKPLPAITPPFAAWTVTGAVAQMVATAFMLMAMRERSFVVATAYLKTEPVLVAVFGLAFLGDALTVPVTGAILIATAGVMILSWTPGARLSSARPAAFGIAAAALFGLSAVGFRGGILAFGSDSFVIGATVTLAASLLIQTALLLVYLVVLDRRALRALVKAWRPSLLAGFLGAGASELWFLAFALTTAANVRTLALIEVVFAQIVSHRLFVQRTAGRDVAGILLVVGGIALLLWAH
ncbi:MAG TPA: EamA family transporter [Xanthobacteraceae bacterium]|nr:EamA family transporter [Xanthobacteraceae bacterium]